QHELAPGLDRSQHPGRGAHHRQNHALRKAVRPGSPDIVWCLSCRICHQELSRIGVEALKGGKFDFERPEPMTVTGQTSKPVPVQRSVMHSDDLMFQKKSRSRSRVCSKPRSTTRTSPHKGL